MFERIILAVDGAGEAGGAIAATVDLARKSGGKVLVVHVGDRGDGCRPGPAGLAAAGPADARLVANVVDAVRSQGVAARSELRTSRGGEVAREILLAAGEFDAGAIVLGSRRLGACAGLLLGSVAYKVIQLADCPVMVVRPEATSGAAPLPSPATPA